MHIHIHRYRVYIGYDIGDLFYDDDSNLEEFHARISRDLLVPAQGENIDISVAVMGFWNELKKPGPMFNFLSAAAVADGADYVYRINDDTEFVTRCVYVCVYVCMYVCM
jgi:hypothetical protein